jgi:pimeloyl-ACP methyl ester carboxylesterase
VTTRVPRRLLAILLGVGAFGLLLMLGIDTFVRSMVYPAPPVRVPSPAPSPLVEVWLPARPFSHAAPSAGAETPIHGWWLPPPRAGAPVVLMLHGNGENLATMEQGGLFADFARLGSGVLAIDYPGYGRSRGTPAEASNTDAAESAWEWLGAHAARSPRVLAGWSLGAAVASQLAGRRSDELAGLVLLSGWNRLPDVAGLHFPQWIVEATLPETYDSVAAVGRVRCPALVAHGARDPIIPVGLGRQLFAALAGPKRWLEIPAAGHNDLLGHAEVWQAIGALLAQVSGRDATAAAPGGNAS